MNDAKRAMIFERLREANPNPTTELAHMSPFELLVAVVLSAQSTDAGVNKATAKLFPVANTPAAIARLGVEGLTPTSPRWDCSATRRRRSWASPRSCCASTPARCRARARRSRRCRAWDARPPT
jgi:hypothetical protein